MILKDKTGKIYDTNDLNILSNKGTSTIVYDVSPTQILKVLKNKVGYSETEIIVHEELMNRDYHSLVKVYSLLEDEKYKICACLVERCIDQENDLIYRSVSDLIKMIALMEDDLNNYSQAKIYIQDACSRGNFMINDIIKIIDIEKFHYYPHTYISTIQEMNRRQLMMLIKEALMSSNYEDINDSLYYFLSDLEGYIQTELPLLPQYTKRLEKINGSIYNHLK